MSLSLRITALTQAIGAAIKAQGTSLVSGLASKVDKVTGKSLSTNDFTNALKTEHDSAYGYMQASAGGSYVSGGILTPTGGVNFQISAGTGFARNASGVTVPVSWGVKNSTCTIDGSNFIGIDYNGDVLISSQFIGVDHVPIAFVSTALGNTVIAGFSNVKFKLPNALANINEWGRSIIGAMVKSGCNISMQSSPNELKVSLGVGEMYYQFNRFVIADTSTFTRLFNSIEGYIPETAVAALNTVTTGYWNDTSQHYNVALVPLTAGYYVKHMFFINPEGLLYFLYGTAEYDTLDAAKAAPEPAAPAAIMTSICRVATVIVQQGATSVALLNDTRPLFYRLFLTGVTSSPLTVVSHHDLVDNNDGDDHGMYHTDVRGDARYFRQSEILAFLAELATLDSPLLTGTPRVPTASDGTNTTVVASTQFVNTAIATALTAMVNGSPGTLDTLKELADAIGDDPNFAATISTALGNRLRVDATQSLSGAQQLFARTNLGIENAALVDTSTTANIADSFNKRFVTDALLLILQNTSGVNTGDETLSSIKSKLGFATGSNDGYLKAADFATFAAKASTDSPALTGNPTVPTQTEGTANTTVANTQFVAVAVAHAIADIIASSPSALDTLNELATALGGDANFATTVATALGNRLRVDATQTFTSPQRAQARANLGMTDTPLVDTTTTANISDATNKRFITDVMLTLLGNTSGTNTGDETQATIKAKLTFATALVDGYLKATDFATFAAKASLDSPAFINNPTAPTQTVGTSNTTLANTQFVTLGIATAVANLINSSPAALDTLKELSDAIGGDANFASTITTALGNRIRADAAQSFTSPQQLQARQNIGLGGIALTDTSTTANISDSSNKRFVTDALLAILAVTSGTNTGDETLASIKSKLGFATTSTDGYLTAADWTTFAAKAGTASPALTGNPTVPTQIAGTANTTIANTQFVSSAVATAVANLINSSPAALDTLKELSDALGGDANFASTISTALGNRLRVDAAQGLSAPQQTQARANLGMTDTPLVDTTTTANISDATNKRFVTDALLAILGLTSGTNTGDETQATIKTKLGAATASAAGYMTAAYAGKLDGIANNANNYVHPNHSGHVASTGDGGTVIQSNVVTNDMLTTVASGTIKGRKSASSGAAEDLTMTQIAAMLSAGAWVRDEDFSQATNPTNWSNVISGTGASFAYLQQAGVLGTVTMSTGTTAAGFCVLHDAGSSSKHLAGAGELCTIIKFQIPTLSSATQRFQLRIGFGDKASATDFTDSCGYVEYNHSVNSGNWVYCTANNASRTKNNSTVAAVALSGNNWNYLKVITNAAGTQSDIYIDNVLLGSITTNIPTGATRSFDVVVAMIKTVGTTTRTLNIDRIYQHFIRSDAASANWRV